MSKIEFQSGAFRKKKIYFSQVSNVALRDDSLSLKAKGLYALIQSYITIEDFTLYKSTLKKKCVEKDKAFESTWKELKDAGYLIQYRLQSGKGTYYYEYDLLDEPDIELANEIHSKQNRKTKEQKNHNPKKGGMEKIEPIHTPKKDIMDKGYDGQLGVYNNTDPSNTNLINTDSTTDTSKDAVVAELQKIILEETNIKKLTAYQKKVISSWEIDRLIRAIKIYKNLNGQYFKLLEKIYKDGAKESLTGGSKKKNANDGLLTHDWDYDNLEEMSQKYIQEKLAKEGLLPLTE